MTKNRTLRMPEETENGEESVVETFILKESFDMKLFNRVRSLPSKPWVSSLCSRVRGESCIRL